MTHTTQNPTPTSNPNPKSRTWVVVTLAVFGGLLLLGIAVWAVVGGVIAGLQGRDGGQQIPAATTHVEGAGVTELFVEAAAAEVRVQCATTASEDFVLASSGGSTKWQLHRSGDTVTVEPMRHDQSWWQFGTFGSASVSQATLTMPASACDGTVPLDASFEVGAGALTVTGEFADLELRVGAGSLHASGAAQQLSVEVAAGTADLNLRDVQTAAVEVAMGELTGHLTGAAPLQLDVEVAAGDATLTVPNERYAVTSEVAMGDFTNKLITDPAATEHLVSVEVAVGSLTLLPAARG